MTMAMAVSAHTSRSSLGPASYGVSTDKGIVSAGRLPGSKPQEDGGRRQSVEGEAKGPDDIPAAYHIDNENDPDLIRTPVGDLRCSTWPGDMELGWTDKQRMVLRWW